MAAEDVRYLQFWAIHGVQRSEQRRRSGLDLQSDRTRQQIERARRRTYFAGRDTEIFCRGGQASMSKEQLNGADVGSVLQQVHGEGVPHGMRSDRFGNFVNG